jgi:hypothetical protein
MLLPGKHAHPDETVLAVAAVLLRQLRRRQLVQFDDLHRQVLSEHESDDYLFLPAISLLFILGLLEYRTSVDSFVYVGA